MPSPFLSFFVVFAAALVVAQLFKRMRIPWVVSLIIGGVLVGPFGLNVFIPDPSTEFFSNLGLILLMFLAGTETELSKLRGIRKELIVIGFLLGLIPFATGMLIPLWFGYSFTAAVLIGIVFMSSAVALLIPIFQEKYILGSHLGNVIISATMLIDGISLFLLSVFLQYVKQDLDWTQILLYPVLIITLLVSAWIIPKFQWVMFDNPDTEVSNDIFEKELRFIIMILIGFVVVFEVMGLHTIIAGFFAGLALSKITNNAVLKAKLHAIGYGVFIPIFFVSVGAKVDISIFISDWRVIWLTISIILGLVISKILSSWLAGRTLGFDNTQSVFLGISSLPQLSTSLAVAFLGFEENLLDQSLLASIVGLSLFTSLLAPILINSKLFAVVPQQLPLPDDSETPSDTKQSALF